MTNVTPCTTSKTLRISSTPSIKDRRTLRSQNHQLLPKSKLSTFMIARIAQCYFAWSVCNEFSSCICDP